MHNIYMFVSAIFIMILMIFTAKYLYCEKCFVKRKSWIIFSIIFFTALSPGLFMEGERGDELMILVLLLSFSGMIAVTRKKRRIRGMFLFIPVLGILMSIDMIPVMILNIFLNNQFDFLRAEYRVYEFIYDAVVYTAICIWLRKKFTYAREEIGIWERRILNGNGLLLIVIYLIATSIPDNLSQYGRYFLSGGVIIAIMIIGTSIIMTIESANANHYKMKAEINEHYLQAQLNHFQVYQETQKETRRIRHDMKNHMLAMNDLHERGEYEKLGAYLRELRDMTQNVDKEYRIGNDMADAIINEKFQGIKEQGVQLHIEGSMAGTERIAPIDICTIFANALENALEAVRNLSEEQASVTISVKRNNKIILISFTNPCDRYVSTEETNVKTSKKDKENHGFGMENIKKAAEKYNGNVEVSILEDEQGEKLFNLEVMLIQP